MPTVTPGMRTSEGKISAITVGLIQLAVAIFLILVATHVIDAGPWNAAVPAIGEAVTGWIVRGYQSARTNVKVAALAAANGAPQNATPPQ